MSSTIDLVRAYLRADVPVLLWGAPGTGKTASLLALAEAESAHVEVLIGATLDPLDVAGYLVPPASGSGNVRQLPPPWARRLREALDRHMTAWLVLDELSCAPPSVQAALLRVVHERRVADVDLRGIRVVAASNPADTAADGGELAAASANRWAHVDWIPDVTEWCSGTLRGWGSGYTSIRAESIAASVAAYIHSNPKALLAVPEKSAAGGRAWPSPRSWTSAIRAVEAGADSHIAALARGCVGSSADEWYTYHVSRDLPDPETVLSGESKLPSRGDKISAALSAVAACAARNHPQRDARIERAWKILKASRADLAILAARTLLAASETVPADAVEFAKRLQAGGVK